METTEVGARSSCTGTDVVRVDTRRATLVGFASFGWVLAVCIGVVYGAGLEWVVGDSAAYFRQARALLNGKFVSYYPNGYPALVALIWSVFGEGAVEPLIWVNILAVAGTVGCTFAFGSAWAEKIAVGSVAAIVVAHWPNLLRFAAHVMTDVPATALLTFALLATFLRKPALAGLLFGIGVTFRPSLTPVLLGAIAMLYLRERTGDGRRMALFASLPIGMLLGYGFVQTGHVELGGNFKYNLLKGIGAAGPPLAGIRGTLQVERFEQLTPGALSSAETVAIYLEFAVSHPIVYAKQRFLHFWQMWGPLPFNERLSLWSRLLLGLRAPLVLLAGFGFWRSCDEWGAWLLALPFFGLTVVHVVFFGLPRFALPAIPGLALLASRGFVESWNRISEGWNGITASSGEPRRQ